MFKQLMNKEMLPYSLLCTILVCLTVFFLVGCQSNYTLTGSTTNNGNQRQGSTTSGGSGSKGSTVPTRSTGTTSSTNSTDSTNSGSGSTGSGSIAPCQTQQLLLAFDTFGAATSNEAKQFALVNQSQQSCTLSGYPALQFLDAQFQPVQEQVSQDTQGFLYPPQVPQQFVLQPGGRRTL